MNFLRASYFRKAGAILFIALFAFVHAVKALHTHEISLACHHHQTDNSDADVKAYFSCSICDFQLAKDSDGAVSCFEIAPPLHNIHIYHTYTLPAYTTVVATASGTDPPSFA
ncbi:hypothetical protein [Parafilimonas sp.]|uniref:hypothetical protein n=1 Tax=Parafilimonas sp. TaxID=1969739 RepID=UPI0039E50E37